MMRQFRCYKCGQLFDWPKIVKESRGEYWGFPAYEDTAYSPCCMDSFEEVIGEEDEADD